MSDQKIQVSIFTYPELLDFITFMVRILETVYEKGMVEGLKEAERLAASNSESDNDESGDEVDCA